MGRPTKLTPEVSEVILAAVELGMPDKYAALAAGVHPDTLINWKNRGVQEETITVEVGDYSKAQLLDLAGDRGIPARPSWTKPRIAEHINEHQSIYFEFFRSLREREALFFKNAMESITAMSIKTNDWRGPLALLERRFPEVMGRRLTDDDTMDSDMTGGTSQDAGRMLDRAKEIRIAMLGTGTEGPTQ